MTRSTAVGIAALATMGCAAMLNASARTGTNPLAGTPLEWTGTVAVQGGQQSCTVWPIEDQITVEATAEEICVRGHGHRLVSARVDGPSELDSFVYSDGSGADRSNDPVVARPSKIGSCVQGGGSFAVWRADYDGCIPNRNVGGASLLTATSTYLWLGQTYRWKLASGGP